MKKMLYRKQQIQAKKVLNQQENTEIAIWEGRVGGGGGRCQTWGFSAIMENVLEIKATLNHVKQILYHRIQLLWLNFCLNKPSNWAFLSGKKMFLQLNFAFFHIKAKSFTKTIKNQYSMKVQCQSQLI